MKALTRLALAAFLALSATSAAGAPLSLEIQSEPLPAAPDGQWYVVSNHNHTRASHDSLLPLAQLIEQAEAAGIEALVITDHNSMEALRDPAYAACRALTLIPGEEWSASQWGHAGLIGLKGTEPILPERGIPGMLEDAARRGSLIVLNHPFLWNLSWIPREIEPGVGGIEVWNNWWGTPLMGNSQSLAWWDEALRGGRHLTALGGDDDHGGLLGAMGRPVDLVWASRDASDALVAGMRAGQVVISSDPQGPRLDMEAQGARIGATLHLDGPCEVPLYVRAQGGAGMILRLIGPEGDLAEAEVASEDQTFMTQLPLGLGKSFVRAELLRPRHVLAGMGAIANPVYFEVQPRTPS